MKVCGTIRIALLVSMLIVPLPLAADDPGVEQRDFFDNYAFLQQPGLIPEAQAFRPGKGL